MCLCDHELRAIQYILCNSGNDENKSCFMSALQNNDSAQGQHSQDGKKDRSKYNCKQDIAEPESSEMTLDLFSLGLRRRTVRSFDVFGSRNVAFCYGLVR